MKTYNVKVHIYDQEIEIEAESEDEAEDEALNRIDEVLNNVMLSDCEVVGVDLVDDDEDDE